ncbi:MAG: D-alanyl-D-alanine carboxypeptidase/D-alanyl-D-alanine-endopeptidase [Gemmatimonadota bacterium]|nr:MAG: D-alanyl-D-alanine carboxypeptidase/D-alanyl-D-alanine-endopeptidase [Gemmatimonadota bacterium]
MKHFRLSVLVFAAVVAAACAPAGAGPAEPGPATPVGALRAELEAIFADPAFHNAHWGVMVQSLETGEMIYRQNAEKLFMPASNNKLLTAAVVLARLGPDYRYRTLVATNGSVDEDGVLTGDLVVVGGGDPAISERFYEDDTAAPFRDWADSLRALGVTRIAGDIVGDDNLYDDVHLGPGWSWDYLDDYYAAEIGALLYNEGVVTYKIMPGDSAGAPAEVIALPPTEYLSVDFDVVTVADSSIHFPERGPLPGTVVRSERSPFSNQARIWGSIWTGRDTVTRYIAAHNPTLFFVSVLKEILEGEGIEIAGLPIDIDSLAAESQTDSLAPLFVHESPLLSEIVIPFLKRSQNQIGEMLLRHVGAEDSDDGSVRAGRSAVEATLSGWGITESSYIYVDGSGLSRYNYLSPDAVVRLLRVMYRRPEFDAFYEALPIAGVDGTIDSRMRGTRAEDNARAKTGYIANSRALSGYVTTLDGEVLAFSMIANNFDESIDAAEYLQDLAVERLANFTRR